MPEQNVIISGAGFSVLTSPTSTCAGCWHRHGKWQMKMQLHSCVLLPVRGPQGAESWTANALTAVPIGVQPPQIGVWICSAAYGVPGFHVPQVTKSKQRAIKSPAPGHEPHYPDGDQVSWLPTPCFLLEGMASSCWLHFPCFPFVMLALVLPSLGSCVRLAEGWCNKVPHAWVPSPNRNCSLTFLGNGRLYIWVSAGLGCFPRDPAGTTSPLSLCLPLSFFSLSVCLSVLELAMVPPAPTA